MSITKRRYSVLADFQRVHDFLTRSYDKETLNSYLLPQYFEYAHHLQWFDWLRTPRFGVWEEDGAIVGIACYEMRPGEVHLHTDKAHTALLPELLSWAEAELCSVTEDGKRSLKVWITDKEPNKKAMLEGRGYGLCCTEPVKIFDYKNPFAERKLPDGFTLIDGTKVDIPKLSACFWAGFDHTEPPPPDNDDGNLMSLTAPRSDPSLVTIAVAPNGEYACALGMWFDEQNHYAYLEPLATPPAYRRMGLATICLTEAMKKTKALGAQYCFGGGREFYTCIGFDHVCSRELWEKLW